MDDSAPQLDPDQYDVIVVGSGFPECLLAGALAKAGKSVLVIDPASQYGGAWSTLSMDEVPIYARPAEEATDQTSISPDEPGAEDSADGSKRVPIDCNGCISISNLVQYTDGSDQGASPQIMVDLTPKVLYQGEGLVDLLVASKAHNYVEFKLVESCYIYSNGTLRPVPASKSDVFRDRSLSISDKRTFMAFLNACIQAAAGEGPLKDAFDERPVQQLLQQQGLSPQLQDVVMYGIAMCAQQQQNSSTDSSDGAQQQDTTSAAARSSMSARQALSALQLYVQSIGKFGSGGAFMAPSYGSGTLAEAFVRYAAVNGAVTVLRHGLGHFVVDPATGSCTGVTTSSGQMIKCEAVLANAQVLRHLSSQRAAVTKLSRAIAIIDRPLREGESSVALVLPPGSVGSSQAQPIQGLQMGPATYMAPPGRFVVQLSMMSQAETAEQDLAAAVEALLNTSSLHRAGAAGTAGTAAETAAETAADSTPADVRPRALDVFYLNVHHPTSLSPECLPANVACCCSPDATMFGYQQVLQRCQQLYSSSYGGLQWLSELCAADAAAGGEGLLDEDRDAIDELQALVQSLQADE